MTDTVLWSGKGWAPKKAARDVPPSGRQLLHPERTEQEPNELPLGSQGFSASLWPLFDITGHFGNQICSTPFPSHSQANDGVKTLRLIEVLLLVRVTAFGFAARRQESGGGWAVH